MKHYGFTGTGKVPLTVAQRERLHTELWTRRGGALHLGDCINADAEAHLIASAIQRFGEEGFRLVGHLGDNPKARANLPYDDLRPVKTNLERDDDIIAEAVDGLLACPRLQRREEQRSGTWYTIRHAVIAGRSVLIIWPDGTVEDALAFLQKYGKSGRWRRDFPLIAETKKK